jgi:hypothetical protein
MHRSLWDSNVHAFHLTIGAFGYSMHLINGSLSLWMFGHCLSHEKDLVDRLVWTGAMRTRDGMISTVPQRAVSSN